MPSQWRKAIFGHLEVRNPWTVFLEIWQKWLRQPRDPKGQKWWPPKKRRGLGVYVKLSGRVLYYFLNLFVPSTDLQLTMRSVAWRKIHPKRVLVVRSFLAGYFFRGVTLPLYAPKNPFSIGVNFTGKRVNFGLLHWLCLWELTQRYCATCGEHPAYDLSWAWPSVTFTFTFLCVTCSPKVSLVCICREAPCGLVI